MPTGYTHAVQDGTCTEFNDFVWKCAHIQREEEPSSYHKNELMVTKRKYLRLRKMRQSERLRFSRIQFQKILRNGIKKIRKNQQEHTRYSNMLGRVAMWEPPTKEHIGLKKFMIEQLTTSIGFDCNNEYYLDEIEQGMNDDLHTQALESARRDISYYMKNLAEDQERVDSRNQWKQQLCESVGVPPNASE